MMEEEEKKRKREITDADVLDGIADTDGSSGEATVRKNKSGIVVKGLHDLAVRFSRCCNPVPGDEIVGFVTRGSGRFHPPYRLYQCHQSSEEERVQSDRCRVAGGGKAYARSSILQRSRSLPITGSACFADISKVFTEKQIDITSMNVRTSKQGQGNHYDL